MTEEQIDWKAIAKTLAQKAIFAIYNLKANGTGIIWNMHTGKTIHWKDDFADALELIPRIKIDRESLHNAKKKKKSK
jgi:hypothetical protein